MNVWVRKTEEVDPKVADSWSYLNTDKQFQTKYLKFADLNLNTNKLSKRFQKILHHLTDQPFFIIFISNFIILEHYNFE